MQGGTVLISPGKGEFDISPLFSPVRCSFHENIFRQETPNSMGGGRLMYDTVDDGDDDDDGDGDDDVADDDAEDDDIEDDEVQEEYVEDDDVEEDEEKDENVAEDEVEDDDVEEEDRSQDLGPGKLQVKYRRLLRPLKLDI